MEAKKILSKLNMKNYNNELEKIIESKLFSIDVKNLLLSMLYKIENVYKDYKTVKVEVLPERDFIGYIIQVIKVKCFDIELISPEKEETVKVDKAKGKIRCYPNEKSLLSAIWYMGEEDMMLSVKYPYAKEAMQKIITIGSNMSAEEVLRDFSGWSWDIAAKEIENKEINILYESLLMLDGRQLLYMNIENEEKESLITRRNKKEFTEFFETLLNSSMTLYSKNNKETENKIAEIRKEKEKSLDLLKNKKEFVQEITSKKRQYLSKIEEIDKTINNTDLLKQEYHKRNANLPNKEKIFSISHLADRLEKEREELLKSIKNCNQMIDPKKFVKEKEKLEEEVAFLQAKKTCIDCSKACMQAMKMQIEKTQEKQQLVEWMYKIRYYMHIPYQENMTLKDIKVLEEDFKEMIKLIIKKAQSNKIWDIFTEDEELTYKIIKEIFDTRMISFENINIVCRYENGILYIEYYDGNILESKKEIETKETKIKKKIKLFI